MKQLTRHIATAARYALLFACYNAGAASIESGLTKVSAHTPDVALQPANPLGPLVLSAAPRDNEAEGNRRFGPVAAYISQVLGRKVIYRHPGTWGGYESDMQKGVYDIVFDGPHFVAWRIDKMEHTVLVKFPGAFTYTAIVRKDEKYANMKQLIGRTICAHPPPNLGTLIMYDQFRNPVRQPSVVIVDGYKEIYQALLAKQCDAAMLPLGHVKKFDPDGGQTRIVFQSAPMPQQALSVGPRISPAEHAKLLQALLSPAAEKPLAAVRKDYGLGKPFIAAKNVEYTGLGRYLRDVQGF